MKMVVTGGAGFIGSNLVELLINSNYDVHVIDNFSTGDKKNCIEKAIYHNLDLSKSSNFNEIKKICENVDTIFHMSCIARVQPSIERPIEYEQNNTIGTMNILKAAVDMQARRVVYSSSSSIYGNQTKLPLREDLVADPLSPYGAQKLYGEILCQTFSKVYNIETVSLRYFNVYGERQNIHGAYPLVIGIFLNQYLNNIPLTIRGDGNQKRDFTYVGDVVRANLSASQYANIKPGEIFNIGNGDNRSINQIASYFGCKIQYVEKVFEPFETLADNTKARNKLNWHPTIKVEDWIRDTLKTYRV
tara:strand:+ start:984 stop:1892 length:909 start_codon:yes stop_codon:yes gene_type:complete